MWKRHNGGRQDSILGVFLAGAVLGVALIGLGQPWPVSANHQRFLTGIAWPAQRELQETGVWRWQYVQEPGGANILPAVAQALNEYSSEFGVYMLPDALGNQQIASGGNRFVYGDGTRPGCTAAATACLPEYGPSMKIVYDSASMLPWSFRSQVAVALHEDGHALMDAGEQYRDSGGAIACTGKPWTIMDCGIGHAQFIQDYDRETFRIFHYPAPVAGAAYRDGVLWFAATTPNATRLAISIQSQELAPLLVGYATPCTATGYVCGGVALALPPATCVSVKSESAISWAFTDNWVLAGCKS